VNLDGAAHDRHRIFISAFAMVIESLSQRVESDEAMHARAIPAAGDPRHDVDLLFDAQLSHLEKSTIAGVINTSRDFCPILP